MTRIKSKANSDSKTAKRPIKIGGYSSSVLKATRAAKRAEAEERQARYDGLSIEAKIQLASIRRGLSGKELRKLWAVKTKAA
jgi:hypothetical protein